jgi:hypothetical protein
VTVTATDNRDTAPAIEISVDDGVWTAYTAPVQVTADGAHAVRARATDAAGNVSAIAATEFAIDATAPEVVPEADPIARTVKASATDAGSGVATIEYRFGPDGVWAPYIKTILAEVTEQTVQLRATDKAGVTSEIVDVVLPDGTAQHRRNVALVATPDASFTAGWNSVEGLNDDVQPTSSGDVDPSDNANVWGAWPQVADQWVQYTWTQPVTVDETSAYFVHNLDANGAGIAVPKSWKAQYRDAAGQWIDVAATSPYGTEVDAYNTVAFAAVTTDALRLVLQAQGTAEGSGSLGIKEWRVLEQGAAAPRLDVDITTTTRCVAGKTVLVTSVRNDSGQPVDVAISTPYGSKNVKALGAGKTQSHSFTTRLAEMPAGTVDATVSGQIDGAPVTEQRSVAYVASTCAR